MDSVTLPTRFTIFEDNSAGVIDMLVTRFIKVEVALIVVIKAFVNTVIVRLPYL